MITLESELLNVLNDHLAQKRSRDICFTIILEKNMQVPIGSTDTDYNGICSKIGCRAGYLLIDIQWHDRYFQPGHSNILF
jgi:hypothetical protein